VFVSKKTSKRGYNRTVQIPTSLHADFRAKVKANGQTMNFVIGILIAKYIADQGVQYKYSKSPIRFTPEDLK